MATKIKDISVKVGEYQSGNETKGRYRNIGSIWKNDDGREFIMLDVLCLDSKLVTLNALATKKTEDKIMCSIFDRQEREQSPPAATAAAADDDIPY